MFVFLAILLSLPTGTFKCIGMCNKVVHLILAFLCTKPDLNSFIFNSTDTQNYIAARASLQTWSLSKLSDILYQDERGRIAQIFRAYLDTGWEKKPQNQQAVCRYMHTLVELWIAKLSSDTRTHLFTETAARKSVGEQTAVDLYLY